MVSPELMDLTPKDSLQMHLDKQAYEEALAAGKFKGMPPLSYVLVVREIPTVMDNNLPRMLGFARGLRGSIFRIDGPEE